MDDGSVMTESAAMCLYFAERVPGLIPSEAGQRTEFFRWMVFFPANMYAVFQFRDFPVRWVKGAKTQAAFRDKNSARLREYWAML